MTDSARHPSMLLRASAKAIRCLFWLALLAWLVFTLVWGTLHGWIVPRIEEYRPRIEQAASQALGVPVRIGSVTARTVGLVPSFEMGDVKLLDPQGRTALTLPYVSVTVSPGSLFKLGFEQIYIDRPELDVRRTEQGRILIAGLDLAASPADGTQVKDWLFEQPELVLLGGKIRWTDEQRAAPALELADVNVVVRNSARRHLMRVDATPPEQWGRRFSVVASFREPLVAFKSRVWEEWDGMIFADLSQVDVSQLRRYADLGVELHQGHGALRLWTDWSKGRLVAITADVALDRVNATLGSGLQPLALRSISGRLSGKRLADGVEFETRELAFLTDDGLQWPGGNVSVRYLEPSGQQATGELLADRLDLLALSKIAGRLPIAQEARQALVRHAPQGLVETLQAHWQGPLSGPKRYDIRGRVTGLELAARSAGAPVPAGGTEKMGQPGVRGVAIDFEANQSGGTARIVLQDGALVFPGVFDDPALLVDRLAAEAKWTIDGDRIAVQIPQLTFSNADGEGELQASWRTADPGRAEHGSRFPGVLDLRAAMSRVEGNRVYRYLPVQIAREARDYVRDAVVAGHAGNVRFRVKGDLRNMPFTDPQLGEFRISGFAQDVNFAYVPRGYGAQASDDWPALTQLSGELIFERQSFQVKGAGGRVAGKPGLQVTRATAQIGDLTRDPVLVVGGELKGPLSEMLGVVAGTPMAGWTDHVLDKATASGNAEARLQLSLPILALDKSRVQGTVALMGNDVQVSPDTPLLARARGSVNFTETGFALAGVQARLYGGEVRLDGATRTADAVPSGVNAMKAGAALVLRAQGTIQVDALRAADELGFVAQIARHASGSAAYAGVLTLGRGAPEISLTSNLKGMAVHLPPPFKKDVDEILNLRYENALVPTAAPTGGRNVRAGARLEDRVLVELGSLASLQFQRDLSGERPKLLRGYVAVGLPQAETMRMPESGVAAHVRLDRLDVAAWDTVIGRTPLFGSKPGTNLAALPQTGVPGISIVDGRDYLPTTWSLRVNELAYEGRRLHDLVAGGAREGTTWRANVDAREMGGYLEYRQASGANAGRLYARLARLSLAAADAAEVETLLSQPPQTMPAMDIVVEDFELRGNKLGRVELDAVNRGGEEGAPVVAPREWRLNKLNLTMPEATFSATGNWAAVGAQAPQTTPNPDSAAVTGLRPVVGSKPRAQRTVMNFKLEVADSGQLLSRFGMKEVIRSGKGKLEGQVAWLGTPLQMDYTSLGGRFSVGFEAGQFLKADPGIAKLLGVLSLQSLPRRLALDFRDVFSEGFAFDFVRGDVQIEQGIATTNNLQMKGVSAAVLLEGRADIARETQDILVVVVPEINAGTLSLVATAINPAIGIGSFLAQLFLRRPLIQAGTQEFHVDGSWADPRVTRVERSRTMSPSENAPSGGK